MSRNYEKRQYRPKEEERSRFGFEYVRANINYRTEIPPIPEKPRPRPDEKALDKKIEELQARIDTAKEARKTIKDEIKAVNRAYDDRIQQIKKNIQLGRKCIEVLYSDIDFVGGEIGRVNNKIKNKLNKIDDNSNRIRDLKALSRAPKRSNKKLEEMTLRELDEQKRNIQYQMSTRQLSKKEESELNAQLTKIGRLKVDLNREVPKQTPIVDKSAEVAALQGANDELRAQLQKYREEKNKLLAQRDEIDWKIQCIREDITSFIEEIKEVAQQEQNNEQSRVLYDKKQAFKQQIYDLREQIAQAEKDFAEKTQEYEYEQEKMRWIAWATKVQEEKREEWEAEKAERKRQKLREKEGKETKGEAKTDEAKPEQKEERKRPNKNQKEIDNCAFLIDYCKRLYPSNTQVTQAEKKAVNLQQQLKKGAWAKEKGVQIITSKKAKRDDDEQVPSKPNRSRQAEPEEEPQSGKFTHDYFVQKFFDNAKIIPPSAVEQLDKIIKELEDKVEYYLSHPDEGVEGKFEQDRKFIDKNTKPETTSKFTKSKGPSKVINTEDFPSLS